MRYKVSTWSNSKKWAVKVSCGGVTELEKVQKLAGSPKLGVLLSLRKGLSFLKSRVKHEDIVVVEISNSFVFKWITENTFPKDYAHALFEVFSLLNSLDSQVVFRLNKDVKLVSLARKADIKPNNAISVTPATDLLSEFT